MSLDFDSENTDLCLEERLAGAHTRKDPHNCPAPIAYYPGRRVLFVHSLCEQSAELMDDDSDSAIKDAHSLER